MSHPAWIGIALPATASAAAGAALFGGFAGTMGRSDIGWTFIAELRVRPSDDLRRFIADGKKIIITTVQKFPFILDDIGAQHKDRRFAIIIDEAHSSQGGKAAAALNAALTGAEDGEEDETVEDKPEFKRWLTDTIFSATYDHPTPGLQFQSQS